MKYIPYVIFAIVIAVLATLATLNFSDGDAATASDQQQNPIICVVDSNPAVPSTQRIGVNLTFWTTWGADQYMKNVLMNPGFEGQINRIVVIVTQTDQTSFSDGQNLGQRDGFWKGASFEVRSGQSAGVKGTISNSLNTGANNLPQYFTEGPPPPLAVNDVIVLTMNSNPNPVGQWWLSPTGVTIDNSSPPPGSPGTYYAVMAPTDSAGAECNFYLDAITDRAGNLLTLSGPWQLSFWVRAEGEGAVLNVNFQRLNGTPPFVNEVSTPSGEWQQVIYNFNPTDSSTPGILKLWLSAQTPNTTIHLTNVFLGPTQPSNPSTAWRQDVIDMLKAMRPSYLRDWQGQLGDTFNNRIAPAFARESWTERMIGGDGSLSFGYSIPDVFDLCTQVQANPWIIIPTTLTDGELDAFGNYLAQNPAAANFSEIVLEFGNENWNWIFRSLGLPIPEAHGPVADRAFTRISAAAGSNVKIRKVINGQFYNPWLTLEFAKTAQNYDTMAVGPYFLFSLDAGTPETTILKEMFATNNDLYQQINQGLTPLNKNLATYEVNLHTMSGTMPAAQVNQYVTGAVSGSALAKRLIDGMFNKASPQLVFCLAGYDGQGFDGQGFIKLWGIVRDVSTTKRVRPTGLALTMLNKVIAGSLHAIVPTPPPPPPGGTSQPLPPEANQLTLAAFRTADTWGAAAVNANPTPQLIEIDFPDDSRTLPSQISVLTYNAFLDNNEDSENVKIVDDTIAPNGRKVQLTVPPYGLCVLTPTISTMPASPPAPPPENPQLPENPPSDGAQPGINEPSPSPPPPPPPAHRRHRRWPHRGPSS